MNNATTDLLFEELMQKKDDLDLFLMLHYAFEDVYRRTCIRYFEDIILPRWKKAITIYNNENRLGGLFTLELEAPADLTAILGTWGGCWIHMKGFKSIAPFVFFESQSPGASSFYTGVCVADGKKWPDIIVTPLERLMRARFSSISKWGGRGISHSNQGLHRSWNTRESFLTIAEELKAHLENPDAPCLMADKYLDDAMAIVHIFELAIKESGYKD